MKRLLGFLALGFALLAGPALASNCSPYPYQLTNGQTADANQVMADFNAIAACVNTLSIPTVPISILNGGTGSTTAAGAAAALGAVQTTNNLSDLASASTSRTNLGLGTAATQSTGTFLQVTNNLSDVGTVATARTNLGVGYGSTAGTVAQGNDSRFVGPTQNVQCTYGLLIGDAGGQIYCNTAGTHTLTIPANGAVAFVVTTFVNIVNDCSAGNMTISITTDTLVWFPSGGTGSRTLAACGDATIKKVGTTRWEIVGTGLS